MSHASLCLTVDFDAVSPWLHMGEGTNTPTNRSRGLFGAERGAPRLLDLFTELGADTTWFVTGHTVDSFPDVVEEVAARGHGVQHHGWSHTKPGDFVSRGAERVDLLRGLHSIEELLGERPEGYRSPSWDYSEHTPTLLADLGFEWSSSGMAREFEPYELRVDDAPVDDAYEPGEPVGVVEVPVSWQRDDYPPFAYTGQGFADERAVVDHWRRQFDWMYENVDDGVYVLTLHPQVSGRSARLDLVREFVERVTADRDVALRRVGDVVADYRAD